MIRDPSTAKQHPSHRRYGGQLIMVSARWSSSVTSFEKDPTSLGLYTCLRLRGHYMHGQIISLYWPQPKPPIPPDQDIDQCTTLWAKMQSWMHRHRPTIRLSPLQYLQELIYRKARAHSQNHSTSFQMLVGDLNSSWNPGDHGGSHPPSWTGRPHTAGDDTPPLLPSQHQNTLARK